MCQLCGTQSQDVVREVEDEELQFNTARDHPRREARAHPEPSRRRARNRTGRGSPGRHVRSHSRGTDRLSPRDNGFRRTPTPRGRVPRVARRARARRGVLRRRAAPLRAQCDALVQTMGFPEAIRSETRAVWLAAPRRREKKKALKKTKKKKGHVPRVRDASVPHPVRSRLCTWRACGCVCPCTAGTSRPGPRTAVPGGERARRGRRRRERAGAVLAVGRRRREDRRGAVRGAARAGARRPVHPEDAPRRGLRGAHGARRGERRAQRSSKRPSRVPAHQRGGVRRALRRRARPRRRIRGAGHACAVLVPGTRPAARARLARGRGAAVGSERSARKESYADARRARAAARARRGYHRRGDEGGVRLVGVGRIGVGRGVVRAMARRGNSARWYLYERCYWYLYEV